MALTKAAMIQFTGHSEKAKNIAKARTYIAEAVANGAKIVCLQELFNTIYFCYTEEPEFWKLAEQIPGPTIDQMCEDRGRAQDRARRPDLREGDQGRALQHRRRDRSGRPDHGQVPQVEHPARQDRQS